MQDGKPWGPHIIASIVRLQRCEVFKVLGREPSFNLLAKAQEVGEQLHLYKKVPEQGSCNQEGPVSSLQLLGLLRGDYLRRDTKQLLL